MALTEDGVCVRNSGRPDLYEHGPGHISGPAMTLEEARAAAAQAPAAPAPATLTGRLDEVTAPAAPAAPAVQAAPQAPATAPAGPGRSGTRGEAREPASRRAHAVSCQASRSGGDLVRHSEIPAGLAKARAADIARIPNRVLAKMTRAELANRLVAAGEFRRRPACPASTPTCSATASAWRRRC
jgi:hypothetical protein